MWFESWDSLQRTAVAAVVAYAGVVLFLRISGKRTLSKMNAFDLVVTVALGSTLSSIIVSKNVPLLDGLLAMSLLIALQFAVAWVSVRAKWFEALVKSEPTVLAYRGELRAGAMAEQRVSREEVQAAIRDAGLSRLADAGAVVLETDGTFSVVSMEDLRNTDAEDVITAAMPERDARER
jgi:uncharacterized membrane protein YcaP (DUF421 family)